MRTVRKKVYKFNELSDKAKQKVLDRLIDINVDSEWWDFTYEDAANVGIKITSFELDRNRHCTGEFTCSANEAAQNILNEHGETCETYKTAKNFMDEWQPVFNSYIDETSPAYESPESEAKLIEIEDEFLKSILKDYSIMLQNECEYLMSEKTIIETIEANDYEFLADGTQF